MPCARRGMRKSSRDLLESAWLMLVAAPFAGWLMVGMYVAAALRKRYSDTAARAPSSFLPLSIRQPSAPTEQNRSLARVWGDTLGSFEADR